MFLATRGIFFCGMHISGCKVHNNNAVRFPRCFLDFINNFLHLGQRIFLLIKHMNTQANTTTARIGVWVVTLVFSFREEALEFNSHQSS